MQFYMAYTDLTLLLSDDMVDVWEGTPGSKPIPASRAKAVDWVDVYTMSGGGGPYTCGKSVSVSICVLSNSPFRRMSLRRWKSGTILKESMEKGEEFRACVFCVIPGGCCQSTE